MIVLSLAAAFYVIVAFVEAADSGFEEFRYAIFGTWRSMPAPASTGSPMRTSGTPSNTREQDDGQVLYLGSDGRRTCSKSSRSSATTGRRS